MMQDITQLPWMYREDDDLFEVYPSDEAMGGPANEGAVWAPICREIYKEEDAALIVRAFNNHEALMDALIKIAAFTDTGANAFLDRTGSYSCFDEPGSVEIARAAIANAEKE